MVDMEEGRRNQIRSFFGYTLGERNEKYKKGISAFLVFLSNRVFHLRRRLEYRGTDSEGICGKAEMDDGRGTSGYAKGSLHGIFMQETASDPRPI